jgi:hypothetical protein
MKYRTLYCFLFLLLPASIFAISFDALTYNFGTIYEENGRVSTDFMFKNNTKKTLIIERVVAACGCSTTDIDTRQLAVGQTGKISVTFDPTERPGVFDKSIYVYTNDSTVRLSIQGAVIPSKQTISKLYPYIFQSIRGDKNVLNFGNVLHTQPATEFITLINVSDSPVSLSFLQIPSYITVDQVSYELLPGQEQVVPIRIAAFAKNVWGDVSDKLVFVENKKPINAVQINATIIEDFNVLSAKERTRMPKAAVSSVEVLFGKIKQPKVVTKEITVTNVGTRQLIIRKVETTDPALQVSVNRTKLARNKRAQLKINFQSEKSLGEREHTIKLITNDPINPIQLITVKSNVHK